MKLSKMSKEVKAAAGPNSRFVKDLLHITGLENRPVRSLTIAIHVGEPVVVKAEMFMPDGELKSKNFYLVEVVREVWRNPGGFIC